MKQGLHNLRPGKQGLNPGKHGQRNLQLVVAGIVAVSGLPIPALSSTYIFEGKCAFLLDSSFQENCTALFDDDVLTLMPKGSRQVRILPQQIAYIGLANKSSLKVNEGISLYNNMVPWWQPWSKIPGWVKDATNEKAELHQFSIGYVDNNFNPKIALFVLNDKNKAAAMASELQASSGLSLGESRQADRALDSRLTSRLSKNVQRQAQRLTGMCSEWMFEDAQPVADALDTNVRNTLEEISIFNGSESVAKNLRTIANSAFDYCDGQIKKEIAQAAAEERARLEAIRRREAAARAARAAASASAAAAAYARANAAAVAARESKRAAWNSLAGT